MAEPNATPAHRFKADPRSFIVFGILFGLLSLFMWIAMRRTGSWEVALLPIVLLAASLIWLSRFEIRLSGQTITYRSLFGQRVVNWSDVRRSELHVGIRSYTDRFKPTFRLVIYLHGPSGDRPVVLNLKPFRREDISTLLQMPELRFDQWDDVASLPARDAPRRQVGD